MLRIQQLTVGPLAENAWLLSDPESQRAVLVDPGDEPDRLLAAVDASGCTLEAIWLTHGHFDHIGGIAGVRRVHPVPVLMHPADQFFLDNATLSAGQWGIQLEAPDVVPEPLTDGGVVSLGAYTFTVWHVPGHSPGQVAFIGHGLCVSGDLLFADSIGRTDLPLCDPAAMQQSLERVATLDEVTRVLPGHGVHTTIGRELASNPFLRGPARPRGA